MMSLCAAASIPVKFSLKKLMKFALIAIYIIVVLVTPAWSLETRYVDEVTVVKKFGREWLYFPGRPAPVGFSHNVQILKRYVSENKKVNVFVLSGERETGGFDYHSLLVCHEKRGRWSLDYRMSYSELNLMFDRFTWVREIHEASNLQRATILVASYAFPEEGVENERVRQRWELWDLLEQRKISDLGPADRDQAPPKLKEGGEAPKVEHVEIAHGELWEKDDMQQLLTGAAYVAMRKDDVELLRKLRKMGWDPKQALDVYRLPEDKWPVLHAAVVSRSPRTVKWLLGECGQKKDQLGLYGEFAMKWAVIHEDDADARKVVDILKRPSDGGLAGLIDCLVPEIGSLEPYGEDTRTVVDAAGTPDPNLVYERLRKENQDFKTAADDEGYRTGPEVTAITITIAKTGEGKYSYSIDSDGGGHKGTAISKNGFWLLETAGGWDY